MRWLSAVAKPHHHLLATVKHPLVRAIHPVVFAPSRRPAVAYEAHRCPDAASCSFLFSSSDSLGNQTSVKLARLSLAARVKNSTR